MTDSPGSAGRVTAPGTAEVVLAEPGTYTISYEHQAAGNGPLRVPDAVASMRLEFVSTASGASVPIHALPGDFGYPAGSTQGVTIAEFTVHRAGKYTLVSR